MLTTLAISLALTLALEEAFALVWGLRGRRELGTVVLVNILTNPPVVLLYHTAVGLLGWNALVVTAAQEPAFPARGYVPYILSGVLVVAVAAAAAVLLARRKKRS